MTAPPSPPEVAQCHALDRPEHFGVLSDGAPAVPCDGPHTTETYMIGDLSASPRFSERYPALEERGDVAELACSGSVVRAYVAAHPRQALYGLWTVAFLPTPAEWADGARWVRCDLAVVRQESGPFEPLAMDFSLQNAATTENADDILRCYQGGGAEAVDVRCADSHDSRDVNMWIPVTAEPSELEIVQQCVPSVTEWAAFVGRTAEGVSGALHTESNGSLTLRCAAVDEHVAS